MPNHTSNRLVRVLCVAGSLAALWALAGSAASDPADRDNARAIWPGPEAVNSIFVPTDSPVQYQGKGGKVKSVRGIDLWSAGRPARVNRLLGMLTVRIAPLKHGQAPELNNQQFDALIEDTVINAAATAGASAAVLTDMLKFGDGTALIYYRLVAYAPEGTVPDAPAQKDPPLPGVEANMAPNASVTPIATLHIPDMQEGNVHHLEGLVTLRVCVGIDGQVSSSTIFASSGLKELDDLALKVANHGKYSPAKIDGRPVKSCKDYRYNWKN
jgi:TonB family protein